MLYADPPWHFEVYNEESGVERAAGNHYSTMSLDEICALPVLSLASPDAVLFMWTTVPHLRESVVSRFFRTFGLAERHPALAHAVMAPSIC
ncbi:MAG TPA: MT-A70 family methyltransferase [Lacipirellulaceae bacterium]|nr:MT-A70 family methyltransferase [Lacipirellulaceae bacterium]